MDLMKQCYGDEEGSGKKMADLDALKKLKKVIADDWMKKYMEKMATGGDMEGMGDISAEELAEKGPDDEEAEGPHSLKDELMEYMKPKVKERRPGTAVMIAALQKTKAAPEKKGFSKKKMG